MLYLGDNCIHNFYLGRYIVGYLFGNHVLRFRSRVVVKLNFRPYIRRYENFEYGFPHSNSLMQFELILESCKPHKAARHQTKCDVINDVKLFPTVYPTVYRRIYLRKFLTLSNQTSRYKLICIRNFNNVPGPKNYNATLKLRMTLVKY